MVDYDISTQSGPRRRLPLAPHQMTQRITPADDAIVLSHFGIASLSAERWAMTIDGMVARPQTFDLRALRQFPWTTLEAVHHCAGNPFEPRAPSRRVCNVQWGGHRLVDVLASCGPMPQAGYVWSFGTDGGVFDGVRVEAYGKDFPIDRLEEDVLLAVAMNGESLRRENGFPVRLVVPGFYGTNSVKWLTRMTLAATRIENPFATRWYNDEVLDGAGPPTGRSRPLWQLPPQSIIVGPAPQTRVRRHQPVTVWGWTWADVGTSSVLIANEDGTLHLPALVEPRRDRAWQKFEATWMPNCAGIVNLTARATDRNGDTQPHGNARNAQHVVPIVVIEDSHETT